MTDFSGEALGSGEYDSEFVVVRATELDSLRESLQQERLSAHVTRVLLLAPLMQAIESGVNAVPLSIEPSRKSPEELDQEWKVSKAQKQAYLQKTAAAIRPVNPAGQIKTDASVRRLLDPAASEFSSKYPILVKLLENETTVGALSDLEVTVNQRHLTNILHKISKLENPDTLLVAAEKLEIFRLVLDREQRRRKSASE